MFSIDNSVVIWHVLHFSIIHQIVQNFSDQLRRELCETDSAVRAAARTAVNAEYACAAAPVNGCEARNWGGDKSLFGVVAGDLIAKAGAECDDAGAR